MNNHSEYSPNHSSNGAHPVASASAPGPRCAAYAAILPVLDEPATDQRLARAARAHLATCAYCQARLADYARLDTALRFAYGATATPTLRMEDVMPHLDGSERASKTPIALTTHALPDIDGADETNSAAVSAIQTSGHRVVSQPSASPRRGWRARGRLSPLAPLAPLAAVLLIAVMVAALFAAQSRFRVAGVTSGTPLPPLGTVSIVNSISMVSPTEGWATRFSDPATSAGRFAGLGTSQVTLLHYIGGAWTETFHMTTAQQLLPSLCGSAPTISMDSPSDGWAVTPMVFDGPSGRVSQTLLHYNRHRWSEVATPTDYEVCSVTMLSPTLGWATGYTGNLLAPSKGMGHSSGVSILRYDGHAWRPDSVHYVQSSATNVYVGAITALSPTAAWTTITLQANSGAQQQEGSVVLRLVGGAWEQMANFATMSVTSVSFTSPTEGWAVGAQNTQSLGQLAFLHYHAGKWTVETYPTVPLLNQVYQITIVSPTDGWAVGEAPTTGAPRETLLHYDGHRWTTIFAPPITNRTRTAFAAFAVASAKDIWVVGSAQWPEMSGYPTPIFAPGYNETTNGLFPITALILRYHNGAWQVIES